MPDEVWSAFGGDPTTEPLGRGFSVALAEPPGETDTPAVGDQRPETTAPVISPSQDRFLKWWRLILLLVAVWIPAAGIGLSLFYWWHSLFDKTPAVFAVFVYVVVCTVAAMLLAMAQGARDNPLFAGLAIALMSAVPASVVAAAVLYGHYYCQQVSPCVAGILPY
ncbi:MAG TPA: hypothetical protein VF299_03790 [Mycobacterium sp.]